MKGRADDQTFMRRALELARRAEGQTSPNPMVGCVIVRGGKILAEGYHERAGTDHAEVAALRKVGMKARGATAYVTLEPCDHVGRTGRCSEALIAAGIRRVVCGMRDPNPIVDGRGMRRLEEAGIDVAVGILEDECRALNEGYICWVTRGRPLVTLKAAVSLDGRIAASSGDARWVSSEAARVEAHELRARHDAIVVGARTVRVDDPELTVRIPGREARSPLRVVVDGRLSVPARSRVLGPGTIVVCGARAPAAREKAIRARGAEVLRLATSRPGRIEMNELLGALGALGITSVLVEGGGEIHGELIAAGLVDRLELFVAPKILGARGIPLVAHAGPRHMAEAWQLSVSDVRRVGPDVRISLRA